MKIRAFKIALDTSEGMFGFETTFSANLNIIRGDNSSGKSTIYNSLIYCLGMEELIGGKGPKVLPYAVREWFYYEDKKVSINSSQVLLEIDNEQGTIVTIARSISDAIKSSKLIEIFDGPVLSEGLNPVLIKSTYVHDAGGATKEEGFHQYLEGFLNYKLPSVPSTNSNSQVKLYLQTVFAALIIEQKRGWSDYLANIPYFGIRDARTHVVEFLLNLNVFENNSLLDMLNKESVRLNLDWDIRLRELTKTANNLGILISDIPNKITSEFVADEVSMKKLMHDSEASVEEYLKNLTYEYLKLDPDNTPISSSQEDSSLSNVDELTDNLQRFSHTYESLVAKESLLKASIEEYKNIQIETREDLERNKAALKLKTLGAQLNIPTAQDNCPTCRQSISDSLLHQITSGHEMGLEENINYLSRQSEMMQRQINGIESEIGDIAIIKQDLTVRINEKRNYLYSLKKALFAGESDSKAKYRRQVQIEEEIKNLNSGRSEILAAIEELKDLSNQLAGNKENRKKLPKYLLSIADMEKIKIFQSYFRSNASAVGYTSAKIDEIEINPDSLTPYLSSIELKEIADIKSDSSASDFVRLIWSYLLGLYQSSSFNNNNGNHPGLIMFDEPGQHSMGEEGQRALLKLLTSENNLQSIIAASFEESDIAFNEVTTGLSFKLILLGKKCIQPI